MHPLLVELHKSMHKRLQDVECMIENSSRFPAMELALSCSPLDIYSIFRVDINTLEGLENLWSIIVNGIYDDASLCVDVKTTNSFGHAFTNYSIKLGNYETRAITEADLIRLLNAHKEADDYYKEHMDKIEIRLHRISPTPELDHFRGLTRRIREVYEDLAALQSEWNNTHGL